MLKKISVFTLLGAAHTDQDLLVSVNWGRLEEAKGLQRCEIQGFLLSLHPLL
jgi:hypothetical protein